MIVVGLWLALAAPGTYLVSLGNLAANFGWVGCAPLNVEWFCAGDPVYERGNRP